MGRLCLLLSLLLLVMKGKTQSVYDFKILRYDEDYSFLEKDSSADWYERLKYQPLFNISKVYSSVGGDIRYQYFWFENENWGETGKLHEQYIMTRYLGHLDMHAGKYFRTFLQLQSSLAGGDDRDFSPVDVNQLDLHQLFVDGTFPLNAQALLTLRAGRQELYYGSQRLVSVREGPNSRKSFDGVKLKFSSKTLQTDVFYTHDVIARPLIFDDKFNKNTRLWGLYAVFDHLPFLQHADLYYLGLHKSSATFDEGSAAERRHSIGSRIWRKTESWQYDFEAVYQWGRFGAANIAAWTISSNTSYTFKFVKLQPLLGLKTELISGDHRYDDGQLNTFNPLFPRGAYFGLAALIGPSNLVDVHPYTEWKLTSGLSLQCDLDIFWRMSREDGIYGPNVQMIYSGTASSSREIGQQLGLALEYIPHQFVHFTLEFTSFMAGDYLKEVGTGKNILMTAITLQFTF